MTQSGSHTPLLEMRGIDKSFAGVHAVKGVDLTLHRGEVLALLGENGAGKSTLIKVLGGAHVADRGSIFIDGQKIHVTHPVEAQKAGISIIYQEFNLIPDLTVWENITLGREHARHGFVQKSQEIQHARELFQKIGLEIDPNDLCRDISVGQQQTVEIAKALSINARIMVMDEPSAALTTREVEALFNIIRELQRHGIGIIYISHRLDEVFEICDSVMVMRDGELVGTAAVKETTKERLIEMMVGRSLDEEFPKVNAPVGKELLRVESLKRGHKVNNVSFQVRAGEVLGFSGLVGAGRTETMRLIFGADLPDSGQIFMNDRQIAINSPSDAMRYRICLLSENRKEEGILLGASVLENFGLPNLKEFSTGIFVNERQEKQAFTGFVESLKIKISSHDELAKNLSGGNQQKLVLAKWLQQNCDVIIFDEPTRGIDVGAKYEIYLLINQLAAAGKAIIMVSSELPEILGMSDRIIVMHEGRIVGEIQDVEHATQEQILGMAIG